MVQSSFLWLSEPFCAELLGSFSTAQLSISAKFSPSVSICLGKLSRPHCSPWKHMVCFREIIPFYGRIIQVRELWNVTNQGLFKGNHPKRRSVSLLCLVGGIPTPLKNMGSSIGMMTFTVYGKIKSMFQTTNLMFYDSYVTTTLYLFCGPTIQVIVNHHFFTQ